MRVLTPNLEWMHVCDHCAHPELYHVIESPAGTVEICEDCTKRFLGEEADYDRFKPTEQSDHVDEAKKRQLINDGFTGQSIH